MNKEYFNGLRPIDQAEVSCVVKKTIDSIIDEQFNFAQVTAFIELLKEELGYLDVVSRDMVESRISVCGTTAVENGPECKSGPDDTTYQADS